MIKDDITGGRKMFCHQCGAELADGMQFCPSCGTKISVVVPTENQVFSQKTEATLTLSILGEPVYFDGTMDFYVGLREGFEKLGDELSKEFADDFYSNYRDMDALIREFPEDFSGIFKEATDTMNGLLSELKIFGVTNEELAPLTEKYCYHTYLELQKINEQYQEIVGRQEGMREYRQARKDSRGRLVGGGFGLGGAAKGIVTAGAVNVATGALHSVGNAIGNMGSAISAANAKDRLFKSGIVSYLEYAIKQDILGLHIVVAEIITDRTGKRIYTFTEEDEKRANKIWADLECSIIPSESEQTAVVRMLSTYPFNSRYYQSAVRLFPERFEEIREFAKYFGFEIDTFYDEMLELLDPAVEILLEYRDELENLLVDDLDYEEEKIEGLSTDLEDMLGYFDCVFAWADEDGFYFFPDEDDKGKSKLNGAKSTYAQYGNETPLILYDSTLGKSGKSGFLITNKRLYMKDVEKPIVLSLHDAIRVCIHKQLILHGVLWERVPITIRLHCVSS